MNLEVQDKIASYTFEYEKVNKNLPIDITTALIKIFDNGGTELVTEKTMTIVDNKATYTVDFSIDPDNGSWDIDRNFKAELNIDGDFIPQLFDIVKYPFVNHVKDQDLFNEADELQSNASTETGEADSGTTTTLVDSNRDEVDDWWNGGLIKIWQDENTSKITEHTITDFDGSTGLITYTPARDDAVVVNDNYELRRSYQLDINRAGDIVKADLLKKEFRAYLVLDDYQLFNLVLWKTLERYFGARKNDGADNSAFSDRYLYFKNLYDSEYESLPLNYDSNEDGNIDPDLEENVGKDIILNR